MESSDGEAKTLPSICTKSFKESKHPTGFWGVCREWSPGTDDDRPITQHTEYGSKNMAAAFDSVHYGEAFEGLNAMASLVIDRSVPTGELRWKDSDGDSGQRKVGIGSFDVCDMVAMITDDYSIEVRVNKTTHRSIRKAITSETRNGELDGWSTAFCDWAEANG